MIGDDVLESRMRHAKAAFDAHEMPDGGVIRVAGLWFHDGNRVCLPVAVGGDPGKFTVEFGFSGDFVIKAELSVKLEVIGSNPYRMHGHNHPFQPEIKGVGDEYWDGSVHAFIEHGDDWVNIYEWSSHFTGRGDTVQALKWLKEKFGNVGAISVGSIDEDGIESPTVFYWRHMRDKGLVDRLVYDDGEPVPEDMVSAPGV